MADSLLSLREFDNASPVLAKAEAIICRVGVAAIDEAAGHGGRKRLQVMQDLTNDENFSEEAWPSFASRLLTELIRGLRDEVVACSFLSEDRASHILAAFASEESWEERIRCELLPSPEPSIGNEHEDAEKTATSRPSSDIPAPGLSHLERTLIRMGDVIARELAQECGLAFDLASYLVAQARISTFGRYLEEANDQRLLDYFSELDRHGRLTSDVLLEHACRGDSSVFFATIAVAVDLNLDVEMVTAFIEDGGVMMLERLLDRTDLIEPARQAILAAYQEATNSRS